MRESKIETDVCRAARAAGWLPFKFASPGQRGVPDRLFIRDGRVIFIEFKAPGKRATKLQNYLHDKMRSHGAEVFVIDSLGAGLAVIA